VNAHGKYAAGRKVFFDNRRRCVVLYAALFRWLPFAQGGAPIDCREYLIDVCGGRQNAQALGDGQKLKSSPRVPHKHGGSP
jgi:hypothetical protein